MVVRTIAATDSSNRSNMNIDSNNTIVVMVVIVKLIVVIQVFATKHPPGKYDHEMVSSPEEIGTQVS